MPDRARTPAAEREHDRDELLSVLGELVDVRRRGGWQLAARDDPVALELTQPLAEDVRRDTRQAVTQIGESPRTEDELSQHEQRPALADEVEGAGDAALLLVAPVWSPVVHKKF